MDLMDKIAVVTGGNSGIGRATCGALATRGVKHVAVVDRAEDVRAFCKTLNGEMGREVLIPFVGDVTDVEFRKATFAELKKSFGAVHICVPAAGIVRDQLAVKMDKTTGKAALYPVEVFRQTFELNVLAAVYWALETLASVAEDRFTKKLGRWDPKEPPAGTIVFIGSVSSAGNRGQISYSASKAALEAVTNTLGVEANYHGVRCAIIHPGFTDTPMLHALGEEYIKDHILPNTTLRRLLRPEEIADGIIFLIQNSAISGALWADAGWHPAA